MPTTRSKRKAAQIADDRISATEAKPLNDKDTEGLKQTSRKRSKTSKATTSTTKKSATKKRTTKKSTSKKSTSTKKSDKQSTESQSQKSSKTDPKSNAYVLRDPSNPTAKDIAHIKWKNRSRKNEEIPRDRVSNLPSGCKHVSIAKIGPTAKSLGIPYSKACIGYNSYGPRYYGIVIYEDDYEDLRIGLKFKRQKKAKLRETAAERAAKRQKKAEEEREKAERAELGVKSEGFDGWLEQKGVSPLSTLGRALASMLDDKAENIEQYIADANKVYATALKRQAALWSALKSVDVAALPLLPADVSAAVEKYLTAGGESDLAAAVIGAAKAFVRAVGDCSWRARLASLLDEPRRVTDVAELVLRDHDDNDADKGENQTLNQADDCGLHTNDSAKRLMKQLEKSKTFALDANTGYLSLAVQSASAAATRARRRAEITLALKAKGVLSPFDDDVQQLVEEYAGGEEYLAQREAKRLSSTKITVAELKKQATQLAIAGRSKLTRTELLTAVAAATTPENVRSLDELLTSSCVRAAVNRINKYRDHLMKIGAVNLLQNVVSQYVIPQRSRSWHPLNRKPKDLLQQSIEDYVNEALSLCDIVVRQDDWDGKVSASERGAQFKQQAIDAVVDGGKNVRATINETKAAYLKWREEFIAERTQANKIAKARQVIIEKKLTEFGFSPVKNWQRPSRYEQPSKHVLNVDDGLHNAMAFYEELRDVIENDKVPADLPWQMKAVRGRISELHKVAEKAGMLVPPRLHLYSEAVEWFLADAPLPDASDPFVHLSLHSRLQIVQFVRTGASVPIDSDDSEYESEDDAFQSLRALARSSRVMALTIALDALRLKSRLSVALADLLCDPAQRSNWLAIEAHRAESSVVSPKVARAVECIVAAAEKKHGIKLGRAISKASAAAREELRVRRGEWGSNLSYMDPENAKKSPVALQRTLYRFYTRVKRKALHWSVFSDSVDLADDDESSSSSEDAAVENETESEDEYGDASFAEGYFDYDGYYNW